MLRTLKQKIRRLPSVQKIRRIYNLSKSNFDLHYKPEDLHAEYYQAVTKTGDRELEHQIGRISNFKKIIGEIKDQNISGDVIEFGSWQGFSLLWLSYLLERQAIFNKKIIGIDCFTGLPNTEGVFMEGAFSDTSRDECARNLKNSPHLYDATKRNIFIEDFLFSKKEPLLKRVKEITQGKFCLIHIDSDISSSLYDIQAILKEGDLMADTCYLLFDDYGCMDSYKEAVAKIIKELSQHYTITEHSKTALTKNFILKKIK